MSRVLLESGDALLLEDSDDLLLEDGGEEPSPEEPPDEEPEPPPPPPAPAGKWLVLARAFLDSATENIAGKRVTHPTWEYEGRALSFGQIDRSIPTPAGMPQVGDARVRLADTDRRWRNLLSRQTARQRLMELKLVQEDASESAQEPIFTGAIVQMEFGPGYIDVELRDKSFAWLDEEIPNFINRTNFPDLAEGIDEAFLPIIAGINRSSGDNPTGQIKLPHIGWDGTKDRWGVAAHPVWDVPAVRRKAVDEDGGETWPIVDPSEYAINEEEMSFAEVPSLTFHPAFLDFTVEQPAGTEIRVDVEGMDFRGGWEGIPPAGYDATHNPTGTPGPLRNPIDVFINFIFLVMHKAGVTASTWEVSTIEATLQQFSGQASADAYYSAQLGDFELGQAQAGDSGASSTTPPFFVDGALTESMTLRALLGRFLPSFELNFYQQKNGKLALTYTEDTDEGRPVFDDISHILRNTLFERLASPTINRMTFRYAHNYATEEWGITQIQDNDADQEALGVLEEDVFDMYWVRDPVTAAYVAARRMSFLALGAYRQSFELPLPEVFEDIELAKLVGITHWAGADFEGYLNREVKITGLLMDLDRLTVKASSIFRVPQSIVAPPIQGEEVFCDAFTRGPLTNDLGADWQIDTLPGIDGSRVQANVANDGSHPGELLWDHGGAVNQHVNMGCVAIPLTADDLDGQHQYASVVIREWVPNNGDIRIGPCVMWTGLLSDETGSAYFLQWQHTGTVTVSLYRVKDNVETLLDGPDAITFAADDSVKLAVEPGQSSHTLKAWHNNTLLFEVEDDSEDRLAIAGIPTLWGRFLGTWFTGTDNAYMDDFCCGLGWGPPVPEPAVDELWDDFNHAAEAETIEGPANSGEFNWVTPLRSDGDFAPWKLRLGATLTQRVLQATSGSTDPVNYLVAEEYSFLALCDDATIAADQWAEMVYDSEANPLHGRFSSGPAVRCSGTTFPAQSGYGLMFRRDSLGGTAAPIWFLELARFFESSGKIDHVVLASTELGRHPLTAGLAFEDVLRIEVQGTTLRGYLNGVQRVTATDATLSSGQLGMHVNARGTRIAWVKWKYWRGGDL